MRPEHALYGLHPGGDTGAKFMPNLIVPATIPGSYSFTPTISLLAGARGKGKTLTMTAIGRMMLDRFIASGQHHKVMSNYHVDFAYYSHPLLIDMLMDFPSWAHHLFVMVDELDAYFPSMRAQTRVSLSFGTFIKQIRKRGIELIFTTQHPQEIDRRLLRQVDLFLYPTLVNRRNDLRLRVWDWWGNYSGDQRVKKWPPWVEPHAEPPDAEWAILNIATMFGQYRTDEVVAPLWSDQRENILMDEWGADITKAAEKAEQAQAQLDGTETEPETAATLFDLIEAQGERFQVHRLYGEAKTLERTITSPKAFRDWLANRGWLVVKDGASFLAIRGDTTDG